MQRKSRTWTAERREPYRGKRRSRGSSILQVAVVVLAVILGLCLIITITMGKYIEYTDDGVKLTLPWEEPDAEPSPSMELIIE